VTPNELDQLAERVAEIVVARIGSSRPIPDGFIDKFEAAKILGASRSSIERWTASGEIPSHKIGGLRRYRASELLSKKAGGVG
jgi:excisionase family DNA binding protein